MAILSFQEKELIETVFCMKGGYVLDFTNQQFKEFMKDVVSYNIYERYQGLSKAKILRRFLEDETDEYVGKLIILLINYMRTKNNNYGVSEININKLYELGKKKLGKRTTIKGDSSTSIKEENIIDYNNLKDKLLDIEKINIQQQKGYAFERFLTELFNTFLLSPRASYKTENDQIDGSFMLNGGTVIIEAKYKKTIIDKDALILFSNKISKKSQFTKGVFITLSNVSDSAINYFNDSSSRFIILTVEELFLICEYKMSLKDILTKKFRYLDETGCIYRHILQL